MKYTIDVTEEDIKNGVACNSGQCAVALAVNRHLKCHSVVSWSRYNNTCNIFIGFQSFKLHNLGLRRFLELFDYGPLRAHDLSPMSFVLDICSDRVTT